MERMDKAIRIWTKFDDMRRTNTEKMIHAACVLKGWEMEPDAPGFQRPFVRLPCPSR